MRRREFITLLGGTASHGRSRRGRSSVRACGASACSPRCRQTIRIGRHALRPSCKGCRNSDGASAAMFGSSTGWGPTISSAYAGTLPKWSRLHRRGPRLLRRDRRQRQPAGRPRPRRAGPYHDVHARVDGFAAGELARTFIERWDRPAAPGDPPRGPAGAGARRAPARSTGCPQTGPTSSRSRGPISGRTPSTTAAASPSRRTASAPSWTRRCRPSPRRGATSTSKTST